jgi:pyridoxamine 5'-phosphate oxidase
MDLNKTLENLRGTYQATRLDIDDCDPNPIMQFDKWLEEAINSRCDEPNAFILSTVKDMKPRGRVLLLKGVHENDFVFYTNYNSAKGQEISLNDNVAMTFLWLPLHRQIRIEGKISKVSKEASDEYFHKRPRGSQLGAIASPQSSKVKDRGTLEKMFHEAESKYKGQEVLPRPTHWGGYSVTPTYIEFWQGRDNRLHDRICYENVNGQWVRSRLAP